MVFEIRKNAGYWRWRNTISLWYLEWLGSSLEHNAHSGSWYEHDDPLHRAKPGYHYSASKVEGL